MTQRFRGITWKADYRSTGPIRFSLGTDRSACVMPVEIAWENVRDFATAVVGYPVASPGDNYLSRVIPWSVGLPAESGTATEDFLYASSMEIEGFGVPTDRVCLAGSNESALPRFKKARCTIHFDTRTFPVLDDAQLIAANATVGGTLDESTWKRYVTKVIRPQGEFMTFQGDSSAYFVAGVTNSGSAVPITTGINKYLISANVSVTWHQIPESAIPAGFYAPDGANKAIDNCLGRVNDATFNGFKQGTLLLLAVELRPSVSPLGARIYDITYMFKHFNPTNNPQHPIVSAGFPGGLDIVGGNNHVYVTKAKLPTGYDAGWYEAISDSTLATSAPWTNFNNKTNGINIYDFANFKMLFRPSTYSLGA